MNIIFVCILYYLLDNTKVEKVWDRQKNLLWRGVNLVILLCLQLERFVEWQTSTDRQTRHVLELHSIHLCLQTVLATLQTSTASTAHYIQYVINIIVSNNNKKAQLSLTNPRDAKVCQNCSNSTCLQHCRWQYWPIFLLVTNSNFGRIYCRFRDIDA